MSKVWTFEKMSSSHLTFMRIISFIPFENRTLNFIGSKILTFYVNIILICYNSMWWGYGVRMLAHKNFEVEYICELIVVVGVSFRYLILYTNRDKLMELVELCKNLWERLKDNEGTIIRSFERKAYYFRTFMLLNSLAVVTIFIVTAIFIQQKSGASGNGTVEKTLPFRFYVAVNDDTTFMYVWAFQAIVCYTVPIEIAAIETVSLYLIMMACGYLRSIRYRLLHLRELQNTKIPTDPIFHGNQLDYIYSEVLICAKYHQEIMMFCETMEILTRKVFFVQVFTTIYNMSIAGIQILEDDVGKFKFIAIMILNLFQFLTCQWAPEFLLRESEAIGKAAYFVSMENSEFDKKTNQLLLLIMLRAQRPIQLTAGGYIKLSMETFANMVKSAFSFFTLLRSFSG